MVTNYENSVALSGAPLRYSSKARALRILIADEARGFRKFIRRRFEADGEFEVVGEVLSGNELLPLARELRPDVVVVDIALSGMAGLEGTRRIKAEMPSTRVIFLSVIDEEALREAAGRYGADDFLSKDVPISELLSHIRRGVPNAFWKGF